MIKTLRPEDQSQARMAYYTLACEGLRRRILDHQIWDEQINDHLQGGAVRLSVTIDLSPDTGLLLRAVFMPDIPEKLMQEAHDREHAYEARASS